MIQRKLSIKITDIDRLKYRIDGVKGILGVAGFGSVLFEIFRPGINKTGELTFCIYDKNSKAIFIDGFKGQFYSSDFDNRKIIKWIGENAIHLIAEKTLNENSNRIL